MCPEMSWTSQRDWEDSMHKGKAFFGGVCGVIWLDTDVEKADATLELFSHGRDLATDRREGVVIRWRIVGPRDRECGEGG